MSENCNEECGSCSENCDTRKEDQTDFKEKLNGLSSVKKVYGIISGKGGVGKSMVTSMLAVSMMRKGYKTAILDADITGPSIPKTFGLKGEVEQNELGLFPARSKKGIEVMSVNLLLKSETEPVVWRGPLLAGMVKQFWTDVIWKDIDYMFVDMPPGTGDVPLTVFQSLPIDGLVVVTAPQELVSMIATKAVNMAKMMKIPIVGIVENMSYFKCPDCDSIHKIFGESNIDSIAKEHNIKIVAKLPIDAKLAKACDMGEIEDFEGDELADIVKSIES